VATVPESLSGSSCTLQLIIRSAKTINCLTLHLKEHKI
jgi:hypothetical protein